MSCTCIRNRLQLWPANCINVTQKLVQVFFAERNDCLQCELLLGIRSFIWPCPPRLKAAVCNCRGQKQKQCRLECITAIIVARCRSRENSTKEHFVHCICVRWTGWRFSFTINCLYKRSSQALKLHRGLDRNNSCEIPRSRTWTVHAHAIALLSRKYEEEKALRKWLWNKLCIYSRSLKQKTHRERERNAGMEKEEKWCRKETGDVVHYTNLQMPQIVSRVKNLEYFIPDLPFQPW